MQLTATKKVTESRQIADPSPKLRCTGDRLIIVFQQPKQPELLHHNNQLIGLEGIELELIAEQVLS